MAQQANFVLYDGAATPVAHTFQANGITREGDVLVASWREQLATVPTYAQCVYTQLLRKLRSGVFWACVRVEVPVLEQASGQNAAGYTAPPKVAYVDRSEFVQWIHPRSTETTRRICTQMLINAIVDNHATAAASATGIALDLVQRQIQVS